MVISTPDGTITRGQHRARVHVETSYSHLVMVFGPPDLQPAGWLLNIMQDGRRCPATVVLRPDPHARFILADHADTTGVWELTGVTDTVCRPVLAAIRGDQF
jgi:hypothetical protein